MAQYDDVTTIDPNSTSGSALGAIVQAIVGHLLSGGYGVGVPTDASAGYIGAENTGGIPEAYVFDGTSAFALFSIANILGTVSADGAGANTGAIVEIGETSGTLYIKFAGGLAICAAILNSHPAGTETWALPVTFTDTGKMWTFGVCQSVANQRFVSMRPQTVTAVDVGVYTSAGAGASTDISALCIGYWTEEFI